MAKFSSANPWRHESRCHLAESTHHRLICYFLQVLMDMFKQEDAILFNDEETSTRQTYEEVVKDLILDEKQ